MTPEKVRLSKTLNKLIIVIVILVFFLGFVFMPAVDKGNGYWNSSTVQPSLLAYLISALALFLNKKGRFQLALDIYILIFIIPPWWAVFRSNSPEFVPLGIACSASLIALGILAADWWRMTIVAVIGLLVLILVPLNYFGYTWYTLFPMITVMSVLSLMIVVFTQYRNILERERLKELNRLNHELKVQTDALNISNRQYQQISYVAAHDLKSPLTNLLALVEMLENQGLIQDSDDARVVLDKMKTSNARMQDIINSLNNVFSVQDKLDVPKEELELKEILKETLEILSSEIDKSNTQVSFNFENAPKVEYPSIHLISILQNLITNSIKYQKQDQSPRIEISSKADKSGKVLVTYKDNSIGIDMNRYGNKLFGLFQRFNQEIKGNGIGLFLVKTIIEKYGGRIEVESSPGKGMKFDFLI